MGHLLRVEKVSLPLLTIAESSGLAHKSLYLIRCIRLQHFLDLFDNYEELLPNINGSAQGMHSAWIYYSAHSKSLAYLSPCPHVVVFASWLSQPDVRRSDSLCAILPPPPRSPLWGDARCCGCTLCVHVTIKMTMNQGSMPSRFMKTDKINILMLSASLPRFAFPTSRTIDQQLHERKKNPIFWFIFLLLCCNFPAALSPQVKNKKRTKKRRCTLSAFAIVRRVFWSWALLQHHQRTTQAIFVRPQWPS